MPILVEPPAPKIMSLASPAVDLSGIDWDEAFEMDSSSHPDEPRGCSQTAVDLSGVDWEDQSMDSPCYVDVAADLYLTDSEGVDTTQPDASQSKFRISLQR
jgi:hypothetical protein